jgi:peptidoglycan/LPS O-acetylase OafA/YrhL
MISGFVIPFSLMRHSAGPSFLLNRALRIYPVYAAGLAVTVAVIAAMDHLFGNPGLSPSIIASQVPGVHDLLGGPSIDGIIWTLEIEVRFYLVAALLIGLFHRGSPLILATPLCLAAVVLLARASLPVVGHPWLTAAAGSLAMSAQYMIFMFVGVALHCHYRGLIGPRTAAAAVLAFLVLSSPRRPSRTKACSFATICTPPGCSWRPIA